MGITLRLLTIFLKFLSLPVIILREYFCNERFILSSDPFAMGLGKIWVCVFFIDVA